MSLTDDWKQWGDIAKSNGIECNVFWMRRKRGRTCEDAATTPKGTRRKKIVEPPTEEEKKNRLTEEDYKTAAANDIPRATAYYRFEYLYWSKEKAITKKPGNKTDWKDWEELAQENNVSYTTWLKRKGKGMSSEEAATEPKKTQGSASKKLDFMIDENGCFICTSHRACREDSGRKSNIIYKNGKNMLMHRWIYIEMYGEIPAGQVVRHKCDNGQCINPEHMELGSQKQNVWDMIERGRFKGYAPKNVDNIVNSGDNQK